MLVTSIRHLHTPTHAIYTRRGELLTYRLPKQMREDMDQSRVGNQSLGNYTDVNQDLPDSNEDQAPLRRESGGNDAQSKAKRIACVLCRKRKLRCDGARPSCGTCKRLAHDCAYDEVRKKSGPKRGYVKLLEARLRRSSVYVWRLQ